MRIEIKVALFVCFSLTTSVIVAAHDQPNNSQRGGSQNTPNPPTVERAFPVPSLVINRINDSKLVRLHVIDILQRD